MPHIAASPAASPIGQRVSLEARKIQRQEDALCQAAPLPPGGLKAADLLKGLQSGASLKMPEGQAYKIQPGDNLSGIARKTLGTNASNGEIEKFMEKVLDLNEDLIKNPHELFVGDTIALPKAPRQGRAATIAEFLD